MGFLYEVLKTAGAVCLIVACVILGAVGIFSGIDYTDCHYFEKATGNKTKWSFGCYVEMDGKYVPKKYFYGDVNELRIKAKD
jgi:hypothetical protein